MFTVKESSQAEKNIHTFNKIVSNTAIMTQLLLFTFSVLSEGGG